MIRRSIIQNFLKKSSEKNGWGFSKNIKQYKINNEGGIIAI